MDLVGKTEEMHSQSNLASHTPVVNGREIDLNEGFRAAVAMMERTSNNVFITGRAGTGKSTLLEYFRSMTRKNVAVLAPTGVAALNVKGQTIHSFFWFRPDITLDAVEEVRYRQRKELYQSLDAIVIDEISMVRADLLDCIDRFMRLNGKDANSPFGGVQMIFIGDLYQLSPVVTDGESELFRSHYKSQYFFDAHSFKEIPVEFIELDEHYRQTDKNFIALLNAIRNDTATAENLNALNDRYDPIYVPQTVERYITLTSTNALADRINDENLERLKGKRYEFKATVTGDFEKKTLPADENLSVKVGMQVMLLNNDTAKRWVNGSIGVVIGVDMGEEGGEAIAVTLADGSDVTVERHAWEVTKLTYDRKQAKLVPHAIGSFTQYPMMPAWAVTIHKSQGKTFDKVIIDIGDGTFAHGQLYVALSRCTTLEGIVLRKRIENRHILMDKRIVEFLQKFKAI